eukprot:6201817-Pyramimonas_sp.AAC.1
MVYTTAWGTHRPVIWTDHGPTGDSKRQWAASFRRGLGDDGDDDDDDDDEDDPAFHTRTLQST